MTDDHTTPNRPPDLTVDDGDGSPATREYWERLPPDPDVESDLEYEIAQWERIETTDGTDTMVLLPADATELREDSFIVVDDDAFVDLPRRR